MAELKTKILLRNDTATAWSTSNPVLGKGEIGIEIDTKKLKIGDGTLEWKLLPYFKGDIDLTGILSDISNLKAKDKEIEGVNATQAQQITALQSKDKTIDAAISRIDKKDSAQDTTISGQGTRLAAVESAYIKSVGYAPNTGVFTFTLQDGSTKTIDLAVEKVVTNFKYSEEKQALILTLADNTTQEVPMGAFINDYTGVTGSEIKVGVSVDNEISASLVNGSIAAGKLASAVNTDIAKGVNAQTRVAAAEGRLSGLDTKTDTTNSTLASVKATIENEKTGLATKASQASLNSVVSTVNEHGKTIATKASASSVTNLTNRVSTNESSISSIKEKNNSQDSLISGLRTDVNTKQTAAQVNSLIQNANINVNKLTQTASEVFILNGGKAAEK